VRRALVTLVVLFLLLVVVPTLLVAVDRHDGQGSRAPARTTP
jgi:hypothetical protein